MRTLCFVFLFAASLLLAQDNDHATATPHKSKDELTLQGCVGRASGDYILIKQNPAITYELQATGKIKLRQYLGQRVEVTGKESPSMSTSSDALTKTGAPSSLTLTITSVKTIAKECPVRSASDQ